MVQRKDFQLFKIKESVDINALGKIKFITPCDYGAQVQKRKSELKKPNKFLNFKIKIKMVIENINKFFPIV